MGAHRLRASKVVGVVTIGYNRGGFNGDKMGSGQVTDPRYRQSGGLRDGRLRMPALAMVNNRLMPVATRGHMVECAFKFQSEWTSHGARLLWEGAKVKT